MEIEDRKRLRRLGGKLGFGAVVMPRERVEFEILLDGRSQE